MLLPQALVPGQVVTAMKFRQGGKSKGWRAARMEGGMVLPPTGGWRDKEYVLFTSPGDFRCSLILHTCCPSRQGLLQREDRGEGGGAQHQAEHQGLTAPLYI